MKRICVYSGSNLGLRSEYKESAKLLGKILAENKIELVYGGSRIGLMGEISNEVLRNNGKVIGVMPKGLFSGEMVHENLTKLIEVENMHERKQTMAELSDGFIALPGGLGTFEELFEVLSWAQLGIHKKPIGILNISNFFDPLLHMIKNTCTEGFMNESNIKLISVSDNPSKLIKQMKNYVPPLMGNKWRELV
ncbi:TIGR00730 family Rossman fold protein [Clostridium botulinum]|uniref:Cytokinin riboside 5'-monophosphate phosphoribohydrolase n=1 Tax=Clostridium botulinum (strain Okra / Type B1) TaxID=498213 RepID=B1IH65_CLOBK|nr:TIGR00730 family Rossman fold protein [Clostridium botulinum]EKX81144.1 decarboxylase [Clostridium botulinum CFSAN001628]ACA43438.1 decarboxylase family protein [Clostridium botulinum B1 str. Okra]MBD5561716.1 TIGR00730 family Rossman fold protein [Clostridium botulinum]MBD5565382.1 TIGR00730 family Rossman fold protein [Clostridium botulinum]MBD5570612.1 TIGR00730 family Rossman fold protein [Clostridium botulinum]